MVQAHLKIFGEHIFLVHVCKIGHVVKERSSRGSFNDQGREEANGYVAILPQELSRAVIADTLCSTMKRSCDVVAFPDEIAHHHAHHELENSSINFLRSKNRRFRDENNPLINKETRVPRGNPSCTECTFPSD